ncbi:hypothetical protein TB1_029535 [Malus domestica]
MIPAKKEKSYVDGNGWKKPSFGVLKVYCDAAWDSKTKKGGDGWVVRVFAIMWHFAGGTGGLFFPSAAVGEVAAVRATLYACLKEGITGIIVESDAKIVISMITRELQLEAADVGVLEFAYSPHRATNTAHVLVADVFKIEENVVWDCIGPDFLFNILTEDVNISIQL